MKPISSQTIMTMPNQIAVKAQAGNQGEEEGKHDDHHGEFFQGIGDDDEQDKNEDKDPPGGQSQIH